MIVQCSCCKVGLQKIKSDIPMISKSGRHYVYHDELGNRWNGRTCGVCHAKKRKQMYSSDNVVELSSRLCRKCNKTLPKTLYFEHVECRAFDWNEIEDIA